VPPQREEGPLAARVSAHVPPADEELLREDELGGKGDEEPSFPIVIIARKAADPQIVGRLKP